MFPSLECNVGLPQPSVGKGYYKIYLIFEVIGQVTIFRNG